MSKYCQTIFDYIKEEETAYTQPIKINESWSWPMKDHLLLSELYTNAQLKNGKSDYTPVKNITLPILNLQHRTEDIDLKDVQIYIDNPDKYHLSMLVKKYHDDIFVVENDLDTYFDKLNVSRIDFGGGLSKKLSNACPEVVPLQSIVFCNQRDILSSPFGLLHEYSPDQLLDMRDKGWGKEKNGATASVEDLITLWRDEEDSQDGIKVYEVHGNLPSRFVDPNADEYDYETRLFIVAFYTPKGGNDEKHGVILYTATEKIEDVFKLIKRDEIYGRALGRGGAEEIFEEQVWTNYDMIRTQSILDSAASTILKSSDPTIAQKHPSGLRHMKTLEVIDIAPGTDLAQVDTFPRNLTLFENHMVMLENSAKNIGGAQDPLQGKEPVSGTPFASLQAQIQQGMGLHEYRRGQFAKHIEEIYKDWIVPHIQREITNGFKFLSELSLEDLQYVADCVVRNETEKMKRNYVLDNGGMAPSPEQIAQYETAVRDEFKKKGNKHFLGALKGEFKNTTLGVKVNVAGKSKNLGAMVDQIVNIFRQAFANPQGFAQVMQMPGMAKGFNQVLEFSGMSPADFSGVDKMTIAQPQPVPSPIQPQLPVKA